MALRAPKISVKPTLLGIGTVKSFGGLVQSKTEGSPYFYENVELKGQGGSPDQKFRLMWAPEFFNPKFDLGGLSAGEKFVFEKNIGSQSAAGGFLEGLCGSEEVSDQLQAELNALPDYEAETIHNCFRDFFNQLGPVPVVYKLKQERKQVDGLTADGKRQYEPGKYYEVDAIYHATEQTMKSLVKSVVKNAEFIAKKVADGKEAPAAIRFKFDPQDFGFDVQVPQEEPAWVG